MQDSQEPDKFVQARRKMLDFDLRGRDITDPAVLKVMAQIPREEFVPEKYRSQAYCDAPLPIGFGQTISQPYIVALMTQHLRLNPYCEVLEIGTGCGYQTAVLCKLAKRVYTIERLPELSEMAQAKLGRVGISNVEFYIGDGSKGWPQQRTFERIMVTAAVPSIPDAMIEQLLEGGIIVAPVGYAGVQDLVVAEKKQAKIRKTSICDVRFVKLIGEYGFAQ